MAAKRMRRDGMSYGELAQFEGCVEQIRESSLSMAKTTREYIRNSMMVSDGDIYTSRLKGDMQTIQKCMRIINAYWKKYGDM